MDYDIADDGSTVRMRGRLSEDSDLTGLAARLQQHAGTVTIDLSAVTRINSCGAREWLNFVRVVPEKVQLVLDKCPVAFVNYLNMISNFAGRATVRSVFVPYLCERCNEITELLAVLGEERLPPREEVLCRSCSRPMELDLHEEQYFLFRVRPPHPGGAAP